MMYGHLMPVVAFCFGPPPGRWEVRTANTRSWWNRRPTTTKTRKNRATRWRSATTSTQRATASARRAAPISGKATVTPIRLGCDSTAVRLPLDCNSTALRPFDDQRYDRGLGL